MGTLAMLPSTLTLNPICRAVFLQADEALGSSGLHRPGIIRCAVPCIGRVYYRRRKHFRKRRSLGHVRCRSVYCYRLATDTDCLRNIVGSAIAWDGNFKSHTADEVFSSVIDLILNCGCFVYIGAWMPFKSFDAPELGITPGRLFALLFAILILRRIPALLFLYRWVPEISDWREALFSGHFGVSASPSIDACF